MPHTPLKYEASDFSLLWEAETLYKILLLFSLFNGDYLETAFAAAGDGSRELMRDVHEYYDYDHPFEQDNPTSFVPGPLLGGILNIVDSVDNYIHPPIPPVPPTPEEEAQKALRELAEAEAQAKLIISILARREMLPKLVIALREQHALQQENSRIYSARWRLADEISPWLPVTQELIDAHVVIQAIISSMNPEVTGLITVLRQYWETKTQLQEFNKKNQYLDNERLYPANEEAIRQALREERKKLTEQHYANFHTIETYDLALLSQLADELKKATVIPERQSNNTVLTMLKAFYDWFAQALQALGYGIRRTSVACYHSFFGQPAQSTPVEIDPAVSQQPLLN